MAKIIQIVVEGATLFALDDAGRIFLKNKAGYPNEESWQQSEPVPFQDWDEEEKSKP